MGIQVFAEGESMSDVKANVQVVIDQLMNEQLTSVQINAMLKVLSMQIYPRDSGLSLVWVSVDEVAEQDINAQVMTKAAFDQLVSNIQATGAPESVPLIVKTGKGYEIISGHHRFRASRQAKIKNLLCLCFESLSKARIFAKQLAHNSITGKSDAQIVKLIWDNIDDVSARFESFIDPKIFDSLPQPVSFKPVDVDMGQLSKTVLFMFLPTQAMDFDAAIEQIMPKTNVDKVYIAHRDAFEGWRAAFQRVQADLDIVNAPTALAEMARLAMERLDQLNAGQP
jgi:hypothetical protein